LQCGLGKNILEIEKISEFFKDCRVTSGHRSSC
jgi:hypothetical protein